MASTRSPYYAFEFCKRQIKSMPLDQILLRGVNRVTEIIHMYAPWRWTLGSLPTFNLASNTQDYTINYPADWLYALKATVADGTSPERLLEIVPALPTNVGLVGQPSQIAYTGTASQSNGPVRISPKPGTITGTQPVLGLYKKTLTPFTSETIYTGTFGFDDEWFWVFEEGLLWQAYLFADDRRAGESQVDNDGKVRYNGQRGNFEAALLSMQQREPRPILAPFQEVQR